MYEKLYGMYLATAVGKMFWKRSSELIEWWDGTVRWKREKVKWSGWWRKYFQEESVYYEFLDQNQEALGVRVGDSNSLAIGVTISSLC